jgi:hypothetical protein
MATAKDVALWMMNELEHLGINGLYQDHAAHNIQRRFGSEFVYTNRNGNWSIDRKVLDEFRKLSGDAVIWDRGQRAWRPRMRGDRPGRQQD